MAEPAATAAGDARTTAALLGALLFFTYAYFAQPPSWNENSRFDLTRSLVERGRVDIDPFHHNTGDKSSYAGHHYSDKAPGASFLALPAYAAYQAYLKATGQPLPASAPATPGRLVEQADDAPEYLVNRSFRRALHLCNLSTNVVAASVLGALFFLALLGQRVHPRQALLATLALSVGSLVFPYATMFYGHVLAAAFLFGAFVLVVLPAQPPGPAGLVLAGLLSGAAVLTELPTAPVAAALGVAAFLRAPRRGDTLWFLVAASGPLVALAVYQHAAFGSPFRSGYAHVSRAEFAEGMSHGVLGVGWPRPGVLAALLVGRARGLLYLSPVLVLAFVGLVRGVRPGTLAPSRVPLVFAGGVVAYFLALNSGYYMWWGGSALGPRHLIPALPFLALGLPHAFRRPAPRVLVLVLLGVSVVNQLVGTAVSPTAPLVHDVLGDHVYAHLVKGRVPLGAGAGNLGHGARLFGPASLLPLLLVWAVVLPVLLRRLPRGPAPPIIRPAVH